MTSARPSAPRQPSAIPTPHASVAAALRAAADLLEVPPPAGVPDALVASPFGLEAEAARTLVRTGRLKTAKIGRKRYAKRSDVLALVDVLADEEAAALASKPVPGSSVREGYLQLVGARKGARR
jgi:hypothetical protein